MSFFKSKKFWIPISLVGIAIIGIGTGVGINAQNYKQNNDLKYIITRIDASSIVIRPLSDENNNSEVSITKKNGSSAKTTTLNPKDLFAFNVKKEQISLKDGFKLPEGVNISFSFANANNKASSLNNGRLGIEIKLEKDNSGFETKVIELTGFKVAINTNIKTILNSTETEKDQLDFVINPVEIPNQQNQQPPKSETVKLTNYVSIDDLNRLVKVKKSDNTLVSNNVFGTNELIENNAGSETKPETDTEEVSLLTYWLRKNSTLSTNGNKDKVTHLTIKGTVKLDRIKKENSTVYFYLTSADVNNPLTIIKTNENNEIVEQTSIDQIKTTNLLATDVTVIPAEVKEAETTTFKDSLKAFNEVGKRYLQDRVDTSLNRELSIGLPTLVTGYNRLYFKPYATNNTNEIPLNLLVSFGSGEYTKTYNTSVTEDLEELKAAGFSFDIYTKKLEGEKDTVAPEDILKHRNDLIRYFFEINFIIPTPKNTPQQPQAQPQQSNTFGVTKFELEGENKLDKKQGNSDTSKLENWMAFISYSYEGIDNQGVLFTPSMSLIHLVPAKSS